MIASSRDKIENLRAAVKKLEHEQKKRTRRMKRVMKLMVREIVDLRDGNTDLCRCAKTTIYTECNKKCLSRFVKIESDKDELSNARQIDEQLVRIEEMKQKRKVKMLAKLASFNKSGIAPPDKIIVSRRSKYNKLMPHYKIVGCNLQIDTDV